MTTLTIFGVRVTVDGTGAFTFPAFGRPVVGGGKVGSASGALFADIDTTVQLPGKHIATINARIGLRKTDRGELLPDPQPSNGVGARRIHPQPTISGRPGAIFRVSDEPIGGAAADVILRSGPIDLEMAFPAAPGGGCFVNQANEVVFAFAPAKDLIADPKLPFDLSTGGGAAIRLDLDVQTLTFSAGSWQLRVRCTSDGVDFLTHSYASAELVHKLTNSPKRIALRFVPNDNAALGLPLHAYATKESAVGTGNPIYVPLAASEHNLQLSFTTGSLPNPRTIVSDICIVPGAKPFKITAYHFATGTNVPASFTPKSPLALQVRVGRGTSPSTFLIAGLHREACGTDGPVVGPGTGVQVTNLSRLLHGHVRQTRFRLIDNGQLFAQEVETEPATSPFRNVAPQLFSRRTAPYLAFDNGATVEVSKEGRAYVKQGDTSGTIEVFNFGAARLLLPLVRHEVVSDKSAETASYVERFEASVKKLGHTYKATRHESWMRDRASPGHEQIALDTLFFPKALPSGAGPLEAAGLREPAVGERNVVFEFGPIDVSVTIPKAEAPDYFPIGLKGSSSKFAKFDGFTLANTDQLFATSNGTEPKKQDGYPIGILKLGRGRTLEEIFAELAGKTGEVHAKPAVPNVQNVHLFSPGALDPSLNAKEWVGLILFAIPVFSSDDPTLKTLLPASLELSALYVALSPQREGTLLQPGRPVGMSIHARLWWRNPIPLTNRPVGVAGEEPKEETGFQIREVDAKWADSKTSYIFLHTSTRFASLFGLNYAADNTGPVLDVMGSYEPITRNLKFVGQLHGELPLLPDGIPTGIPIKQVYLTSAQIVCVNGVVSLTLDGRIETQKFLMFDAGPSDGIGIRFQDLGIVLGDVDATGQTLTSVPKTGRWGKISYPSIQLDLSLPAFDLGFMKLRLRGLGVAWGETKPAHMCDSAHAMTVDRGLSLRFRIELMKMPELGPLSIGQFHLDLRVSVGQSNRAWDSGKLRLEFEDAEFEDFEISLLRFLDVTAKKIAIKTDTNAPYVLLEEVSVTILRKYHIVEKASIAIFGLPDGRSGFFAYVPKPLGLADSKAIRVRWGLVGHNAYLPPATAKDIIEIRSSNEVGDDAIGKAIETIFETRAFMQNAPTAPDRWLFGAGFGFFNILDGKFLIQDGAYYGICIEATFLKEWFGIDVGFSVLYIKAARPEEDAFVVAVRVPRVDIGSFNFTGGVISLEIVLNGGFTLDIGFPWPRDGKRAWDRALGIIMTPFQGSGGFYLRKHTTQDLATGEKTLELSAGFAVQFGLGVAAGGPMFRVWATIGIYGILEGTAWLHFGDKTELRRLRIIGAIGLIGRAAGELNWWIISIRIEVYLSAEARATLDWEIGKPAQLTVAFEVYAGVEASACIGRGWFKICKGIRVNVPIQFQYTLTL